MFGLVPYVRKQNSIMSVLDELMNDGILSMSYPTSLPGNLFAQDMTMKTDIKETETEYLIETELPGIKKEEIDVKLENKMLTISVNRNEEVKDEKEGYIRRERKSGSYSRSFTVSDVNEDDVTAKYEDGILKITLKKTETEVQKTKKSIVVE